MKRVLQIIVCLCLIGHIVKAQEEKFITIKVLDYDTHRPVEGVRVENRSELRGFITDSTGMGKLKCHSLDSLSIDIHRMDYYEITMLASELKNQSHLVFYLIQMSRKSKRGRKAN